MKLVVLFKPIGVHVIKTCKNRYAQHTILYVEVLIWKGKL